MNFQLIHPVYAAVCNTLFDPNCTTSKQVTDPIGYTSSFIQTAIGWLIVVAVIFFLFNFIMAGYNYISSQGDAKKIEAASSSMTNAVLGLALIFVVFAILKIIGIAFGIPNLQNLTLSLPML